MLPIVIDATRDADANQKWALLLRAKPAKRATILYILSGLEKATLK
jgi:hypothetical protein